MLRGVRQYLLGVDDVATFEELTWAVSTACAKLRHGAFALAMGWGMERTFAEAGTVSASYYCAVASCGGGRWENSAENQYGDRDMGYAAMNGINETPVALSRRRRAAIISSRECTFSA
jgi:hypothetical protein